MRRGALNARILRSSIGGSFVAFAAFSSVHAGAPPPPTDDEAGELDESLLLDAVPSVSAASLYDQPTSAAPAAVSVITRDEITRHGWRTLDEVLDHARSFVRSDDRVYPTVGVRGIAVPGDYGSRVLLLLDGTSMNDPVYDGLLLGRLLPVPLELIDRIEIIRGPTSALYGANALLAVVNIVTRRGRDIDGVEAFAEADTAGGWDLTAHGGTRLASGLEYRVGASLYLFDGYDYDFARIARPSDIASEVRDADDEMAVAGSVRVAQRQWSLSGDFSRRAKTIPTGAWDTVLGSDDTWQVDQSLVLAAAFDDHLAGGIDVTSRLAFWHYEYAAQFHHRVGTTEPYVDLRQRDEAYADRVRFEARASANVMPTLRLGASAELDLSLRILQRAATYGPGGEETDGLSDDRPGGAGGVTGLLEWSPSPVFTANVTIRSDYRHDTGFVMSPRVALILTPAPSTVMKALVGTAYRAPTEFELGYTDGITMKTPTRLDEERVTGFELAWEQRFDRALRTTLDAFFYELGDIITLTTDAEDGLLVYANRGEMTSVGLEAEVGFVSEALTIDGSLSVQRTLEGENATVPGSPMFLGKLRVGVPIFGERLSIGADLRYVSPRQTLAGDETEPVVLLGAAISSENLLPGLSLRATFDNILDYRYGDPGSEEQRLDAIPREGFAFRFRLGARF